MATRSITEFREWRFDCREILAVDTTVSLQGRLQPGKGASRRLRKK
jgi:hypothetical protein